VERFRIESTGQIKAVYNSQVGTQFNSTLDNGYFCRAWVNFDGTGSGTITPRASGNVTSVTKNNTGDYTITFTVALPDVNYSVIASCGKGASVSNNDIYMITNFKSAPVSGSVSVASANGGRVLDDAAYISIGVFR
jgi:hypothetical protein